MTSCNKSRKSEIWIFLLFCVPLFLFSQRALSWRLFACLNYGYPALNPAFQTSRDPLDVFLGIQEAPNDCLCKITVRKGNCAYNLWLSDWQFLGDCFVYTRFLAFFYYHSTILIFYRCHDSKEIQKLWYSKVKLGFHLIVTDCINHLEFSSERIETIL